MISGRRGSAIVHRSFALVVLALSLMAVLGAVVSARTLAGEADRSGQGAEAVAAPTLSQCFYPTADSYVDRRYPNDNFGAEDSLLAFQADQDSSELYLAFDLSTIAGGASILEADLELYQLSGGTSGTYHLSAASDAWTESGITWNNSPRGGGFIYDSPVHDDSTGYKLWNALQLVQSWVSGEVENHGFFIDPAGFPNTEFVAREGDFGKQPRLCVEWTEQAISTDLSIDDIEVTQAIQDLNNSVRLVAGKPTFVRLHVRSTSGEYSTYAQLVVTQGSDERVLSPINPGGRIVARPSPDRSVLHHAFLFQLPSDFTEAAISIEAQLNPDTDWRGRFPPESSYANNTATANVSFEEVPEPTLVVYRGQYTTGGATYTTDLTEVYQMVDWLESAFPLPSVALRPLRTQAYGNSLPDCDWANLILLHRRIWDLGFYGAFDVGGSRYYAMVDDGGGFMRGCSMNIPASVAAGPTGVPSAGSWDTDGSYGDWYGAHELAHTYGRKHAEFCGAGGGTTYPYPSGRISPVLSGDEAIFGFDSQTRALYGPNWRDVMTYCNNQWIGDFTYHGLMDFFQDELDAARPLGAGAPVDRLLVIGTLWPETELQPLFVMPDVEELLPREPGEYAIVLRDGGGDELARYPFTPRLIQSGPPAAGSAGEIEVLAVAETVPYVDGTDRVDIEGPGGDVLISISAGSTPPGVTLLSPNGGEILSGDTIPVSWTASDPDGDPLTFHIQYSPDNGLNWEMLAQNLTGNSANIDSDHFTASDEGLLRIWASDGVHTASDQSDGSFTVPNNGPTAEILSPEDGAIVAAGQTVFFEARAYDPDSGLMSGDSVRWVSNIDGLLGTGRRLAVSDMSEGEHAVVLFVNDGQGGLDSETVNVIVVANPSLVPPLPHALQVGPGSIFLEPAVDQATLAIDNQSGPIAIGWEATAGAPWVQLSATSGATPDGITVSYLDSGLRPGVHTATISLTSPDVPGQTVLVNVVLYLPGQLLHLPMLAAP